MKSILKILSLLTRQEKRKLILITFSFVIMALLEVLGVGSIGPFISIATDPNAIHTNEIFARVYNLFSFNSDRLFLLLSGVVVFILIVGSNSFTTRTLYTAFKYVGMRRYSLGLKLFRKYLYQPYTYFLNHNTSELSKNLLTEVDQVVSGVLYPAMEACARGLVGIGLFTFLLILNPLIGLLAGVSLGLAYVGVYLIVRPRLSKLGAGLRESNKLRFKATAEAFGAIKDVKILEKEETFENLYAVGSKTFAENQAKHRIYSTLPRYIIEAIAFGLIILLVIVLVSVEGRFTNILPLLSIYIFAGYRLLPALQVVFRASSHIKYYTQTVNSLHDDLTNDSFAHIGKIPIADLPDSKAELKLVAEPVFIDNFELKEVSYSYPFTDAKVLKNICLEISKNTTIGIAGPTGCGKTTLVDVILGLLPAYEGKILVDGSEIVPTEDKRWQKSFGYVPQQIFLCDDTVEGNIAFGIPRDLIDGDNVISASKIANLDTFIKSNLQNGYDTVVGERGIRLSGGQRQRIGIARALYHDPDILVMDEATSALDSVTEEVVMDAIHNLMHRKTIIIIAHRISTLMECDTIFFMDNGRIAASGSYSELLDGNAHFRAMAKVSD